MRVTSPSFVLVCLLYVGPAIHGCQHGGTGRHFQEGESLPQLAPDQLFRIALERAHRGDFLRAEQYLSAARQKGYDEASVVFWLVSVCAAAGRYQSALSHATSYLQRHPTHWALRLVVASIHEALGELPRAQAELESLVRAEPSRPLLRYRLAMLYLLQPPSFHTRAIPHFEAYLELAPEGRHVEEVRSALAEVNAYATETPLIQSDGKQGAP